MELRYRHRKRSRLYHKGSSVIRLRPRNPIKNSRRPLPQPTPSQEGEVVSVGADAKGNAGVRIAMVAKAGDKILFGKWSGTEIKIDSEELVIMKESDIFGIRA